MTIRSLVLAAIALYLCFATELHADAVVLNDGRRFDGTYVSETDELIVFDVRSGGATIRAKYKKVNVASIEREIKEGPGYYALPIVGPIGFHEGVETFVSAEAFQKALHKVRESGAEYVILVIDTPGGSIDEMNQIVSAISSAKDLHFVAYVTNALSAGAVIAMTCPEIYMAPNGTIGAALPWTVGPDGMPKNIEEKFHSIIRADFRNVTTGGGHSTLLLRGMSETEIELWVVEVQGKPKVIDVASTSPEGRLLKPKGQILTLTSNEALACGLSSGTLNKVDEIKNHLGLLAWHCAEDQAWHDMINYGRATIWKHEDADRRRAEASWRFSEFQRVEPQVLELKAAVAAAEVAELGLIAERDDKLSSLYSAYSLLHADAVAFGVSTYSLDTEYRAEKARIAREFDNQIRAVRQERNKQELQARTLDRRLNELATEIKQLTAGL